MTTASIRCLGVAWGKTCPRRANCARAVSPEDWHAQPFAKSAHGFPAAAEPSDHGWYLLACATWCESYAHYEPLSDAMPLATVATPTRAQLDLFA